MKFTKLRLENSGTGICVRHSLRSKNSEVLFDIFFAAILLTCGMDETLAPDRNLAACCRLSMIPWYLIPGEPKTLSSRNIPFSHIMDPSVL